MDANALARLKRLAGKQTLVLTHYGRKSGKPYEVKIWFVVDGDRVFIGTANVRRQWVRNVQNNPRIEWSAEAASHELPDRRKTGIIPVLISQRLALGYLVADVRGERRALEEDSRLTALFLWTLQTTEAAGNGAETDADDEADDDEEGEDKPKKKKAGFTLIYDVARRFAQPLGIHLDKWEGRIIDTDKGT